jgi:hypothetical protein
MSTDPARRADAGFTTAAFAGLTFALALVAAGGVMLAGQDLRSAERDLRADQERLELDGIATSAAVKLLGEEGAPTLRWSQPSAFGAVAVTVEAEALKINPAELSRPANVELVAAMMGRPAAEEVARAAATLKPAPDGVLHREQVVQMNTQARWRDCALTLASPYSRLTAFVLPAPTSPTGQAREAHAGELWRITVGAPDGSWLDQVVRMTGKPSDPIAVVDESSGRLPGNGRATCLNEALEITGRSL